MSKYTTEVRWICEEAYGITDGTLPRPSVDIITGSQTVQDKVFNFNYPIFDEAYRPVLEQKILKHYYTREIGEETVGLWKLRLNTRLNEIMPYYNKLYESELIKFDPLNTIDLHKEGNRREDEDTTNQNNTTSADLSTGNGARQSSTSGGRWTLFSDTPQGGVNGILGAENEPSIVADGYLTNATHELYDGYQNNENTSSARNSQGNRNSTGAGTRDLGVLYAEHLYGRHGNNPSLLLKDFRDTFLNIDLDIINRLGDLFLNLW